MTVSVRGTPSVDEGDDATFTVSIPEATTDTVEVDWATREALGEDTAEEDVDCPAATGTVSIPAGSTSVTFTVNTTDDTVVENDETFQVVLTEARLAATPSEAVPLGTYQAVGTITDAAAAPTGLAVTVSPGRVGEDAGATDVAVTVNLDGTTQFTVDTPVTVEMVDRPNVKGNASLGVDYTATSASTAIPAGESSVVTTITLTPVDDNYSEDDEIARLSAKSTSFSGSAGKAVRIMDNDTEPVEISLTATPDLLGEASSSTHLDVTATPIGQSSRQIDTVISLSTSDGTAVAGQDFQTAQATVTIPAGQMSASVTLTPVVLDDAAAEDNETLDISGTMPETIQVTAAHVTIEDDDPEPISTSPQATAPPLSEDGGTTTIPVQATLVGEEPEAKTRRSSSPSST